MAKLFNRVLNFVGWDPTEMEEETPQNYGDTNENLFKAQFLQQHNNLKRQPLNKIVNMPGSSQNKVVITQPEDFEEAQEVCDHLKNKLPVVMNLEGIDNAQRFIDFISGAIFALDGSIQKVSDSIFVMTPNNIDIAGNFREELRTKGMFPWLK